MHLLELLHDSIQVTPSSLCHLGNFELVFVLADAENEIVQGERNKENEKL